MKREISEENFKRIQGLAEPLIDTLDSALSKILDFYESNGVVQKSFQLSKLPPNLSIERQYNSFEPPNLSHTKVTFASIAGRSLDAPSWNSVLDEAIRIARKGTSDFSSLKKVVPVNIVAGEKSDSGYHFLSDLNISVQGQSANDAWRATAELARHFGYDVQLVFFWRDKEGAQRPGESGRFVIPELLK